MKPPVRVTLPTSAPWTNTAGNLPQDGAVVIVTASYEGKPTQSAKQFVAWAETLKPGDLAGVRYAVFGCGNRDWHKTYQAIPKKIDALLDAAGAERIKERGEADASGDFFGDFETWYETLWRDLGAALGQEVKADAAGGKLEGRTRPGNTSGHFTAERTATR